MKTSHRKVLAVRSLVLMLVFLWAGNVSAIENLGVIYPEVREPFSRVYVDIIQGIRSNFSGEIYEYPINGNLENIIQLQRERSQLPEAFIVLGNKSLASILSIQKPLFGAVTSVPSKVTLTGAIVLKPAAETYLTRLIDIYPSVSTVHVVYNQAKHQVLIDEATDFLKVRNKKINSLPASDIRESARAYRDIVEDARPGDAVWLISDSGLIDTSLLDVVLDSAWDKRLAVFSSNPSFVKRGALFAIYPDNIGLGRRLAQMARDYSAGTRKAGDIESLKDVKIAYNERTANHIGIKLATDVRERIDLILPDF